MSDAPEPNVSSMPETSIPHLTDSSDSEEGQLVTLEQVQRLADMVKCHESILKFSREILHSGDINIAQEVDHNRFLLTKAQHEHAEALARYTAQEAQRNDPPEPESLGEVQPEARAADAGNQQLRELRLAYDEFRAATEDKVKALEAALLNVGAGKVPCPAPRFSGERGKGKLTAELWVNQFESWLMLKHLGPVEAL